MEKEELKEKTEEIPSENTPEETPSPSNSLNVLSTALNGEEYAEIKHLSSSLGVSVSHMARAVIRLGLANINGVATEAREGLHLRLIKLGK